MGVRARGCGSTVTGGACTVGRGVVGDLSSRQREARREGRVILGVE